jgi:hypothetical protein
MSQTVPNSRALAVDCLLAGIEGGDADNNSGERINQQLKL